MEETITYPLRINKELWERYKNTITKNTTINETIIELIKEKIKELET